MAEPGAQAQPAVELRPARPADAELLARWRREPSIRRFQPLPTSDAESLRRDLREQRGADLRRGRGEKFQWIVEANGRPAGWITLAIINWPHGLAEVGYAMSTGWQGRGVMQEALARLLDEVFAGTTLERIEARCARANLASRRLLERVGFQHEGILRGYFVLDGKRVDNDLYAVLKADWS